MKVLAINGSPRKEGNTSIILNYALTELKNAGIETEVVQIGNKDVRGCISCSMCFKNVDQKCVLKDLDIDVNEIIQKMIKADGILLGAPVYYAGIAGTMKTFLDRSFFVAAANGRLFRNKVGAAIVALRRSGGTTAIDQLNKYFQISEMLMPSSNYWNIAHGRIEGEVEQDAEGIQIAKTLGRNMAWLLKMIEHSKDAIPAPKIEDKVTTSFIR